MIKVSACVIVKNEAGNIQRWLNCVRRLADEIVVVDTGSTDETIRLAEQGGARVVPFLWRDDFAAAKNFALDQVHGEWVIFLDADEYFSPATIDRVLPAIAHFHPQRRIVGLVTRWINFDADDHNRFISAGCQIRIFRNQKTLRYQGKIHEALANLVKGSERQMQLVPEIEIYHTGYTAHLMRGKYKRNLQLLEQTTQKKLHPTEYVYFMNCYEGLEDYEKSLLYAEKAIATGERFVGLETDADAGRITALVRLHRPAAEVNQAIDAAIRRFPDQTEFYFRKGFFCYDEKDYIGAETALQEGLRHQATTKEKLAQCMADNTQRYLPSVYLYLGKIARLQLQLAKAMEYFIQGLQTDRYNVSLLQALLDGLKEQEPVDVIQVLNSLYNKEKDAVFLTEILARRHSGPVYLYYSRQQHKDRDAAEDAWAVGQPQAAVMDMTAFLDSWYRLGIWSALRGGWKEDVSLSLLLPSSYQLAWQELKDGGKITQGIAQAVRRMASGAGHLPLVSILIPTYNRPELFEATLRSALAQTYLNFEVIVCDNSTDDRTEQLIPAYETDCRLRYIRNRGAKTKAANFQPFAELAHGELLQWCMDDDILAKDKLTKMVICLMQHPEVKLVTSQRGFIDAKGKSLPQIQNEFLQIKDEYGIFNGTDVGRMTLMTANNFLGEPSAVLFRRKDLFHHYWQADCRGYKAISDVVMWLELLEQGDCAIFREPLSWYRRHAGQEGQRQEVVLLSRVEWIRLVEEYHRRGVFVDSKADYKSALAHLYADSVNMRGLLPSVTEPLRHTYSEYMRRIENALQQE